MKNSASVLAVLHVNIQCIRNKFLEFDVLLNDNNFDCFCLNEHWLSPDEFSVLKFSRFASAVGFCRTVRIHGGVGIYVRNNIKYMDLNITRFSEEIHCEAAGIFLASEGIQLITLYRSPNGDFNRFLEIISQILNFINISDNIVLTGDFNVHFLESSDHRVLRLNNLLLSFGLRPTVNFNTRYETCLDNVYTNILEDGCRVQSFNTYGLSDHSGVLFRAFLPGDCKAGGTRCSYRPITDEGLFNLCGTLGECSWDFIATSDLGVEGKFSLFMEIIDNAVDVCFPVKTKILSRGSSRNKVTWFSDDLREMRDRLHMLSIVSKQNPMLVTKEMVNSYRRRYRLEISNAKKRANDLYISRSSNKQSAMWDVIRSNSRPGLSSASDKLNAEAFNKFFTEVADNITGNLLPANRNYNEYLSEYPGIEPFVFRAVSYNMVRDVIGSLKNRSSLDCYGLNSRIIKNIKNIIVYPLTRLFNLCVSENVFPSALKIAKVIPVFKNKGSVHHETNYRPISLLPIFSKVIETLMKFQINAYFEDHNLFTQSQYGFRDGKSTTLAVEGLMEFVAEGLEGGLDTYASFFDLTKAFDCVSFEILLKKLTYYNFHPSSIAFVKSYLHGRQQYVSFNRNTSGHLPLRHGVPQGSVLGPLLFLIYINDLPCFTASSPQRHLILFADDTTNLQRYHPSESLQALTHDMQLRIQDWFIANQLSANTAKMQGMSFSLRTRQRDLSGEQSVKFLGILLDPGLTWEAHINQLSSRLSRIIYLIRHLSNLVTKDVLMSAYHGYFVSNMSYAVLNWGHSAHCGRIFGLQRRCVRVLTGLRYRDCCRVCFPELNVLTFPSIYILACLTFVRENISQYSTHRDIHGYPTRNNSNILPDFHRLARTRRGTDYYGVMFFNALPEHVRELSRIAFKSKVKKYLIRKSFYSTEEYLRNDFNDM